MPSRAGQRKVEYIIPDLNSPFDLPIGFYDEEGVSGVVRILKGTNPPFRYEVLVDSHEVVFPVQVEGRDPITNDPPITRAVKLASDQFLSEIGIK